jgi:4-hydroxy-tetrahydrodipicolinate synthase
MRPHIRHCRWLLDQEVGLAIFGTNSEANSMSVTEKRRLFDALLAAGVPPARLMPGTGCCAISDSIELTKRAVQAGVGGVLMLPPFYYKGVSEEGLYRNFATIIAPSRTTGCASTCTTSRPCPARRSRAPWWRGC